MAKIRRTINSSPEFLEKLQKIQGEIKSKNGNEPSLTDLTKEILRVPAFKELERQILEKWGRPFDSRFRIKFD